LKITQLIKPKEKLTHRDIDFMIQRVNALKMSFFSNEKQSMILM